MDAWGVPLRGHATTWSVPGKPSYFEQKMTISGKNPTWFELNPTLEALWNRTDDCSQRYAQKLTQWDVLNEPLHGNVFLSAFPDYEGNLWADIISHVTDNDPGVKTAINDYNIARGDKGRCFNQLTSGVNIDYTGLQSLGFR